MAYKKISYALGRGQRRRRAMHGFGDFNDETQCSNIPAGDAYRKPGNYCATPDGGYTTFNADGSTYVQPGSTSAPASTSIWDKIGGALNVALNQRPPVMTTMPIVPQTGMSTTTMVALAGGAVLIAALLLRK